MKYLLFALLHISLLFGANLGFAQTVDSSDEVRRAQREDAAYYARILEVVALKLAEGLRTDESGALYKHFLTSDTLETGVGLSQIFSDESIAKYTALGIRAMVSDDNELVVYADETAIGESVNFNSILQMARVSKNRLVGQINEGVLQRKHLGDLTLNDELRDRMPPVVAGVVIAVRAKSLEVSTYTTKETRLDACLAGWHGGGIKFEQKTPTHIDGFGLKYSLDEFGEKVVPPTPGEWEEVSQDCDEDATETVTITEDCDEGLNKRWVEIGRTSRQDPANPFVTQVYDDPATKVILKDNCVGREVQNVVTYPETARVGTCADEYPDNPAWLGQVSYLQITTATKTFFTDDPANAVNTQIVGAENIVEENCERRVVEQYPEWRDLPCTSPYTESGVLNQERTRTRVWDEVKDGAKTPVSDTVGAWAVVYNDCSYTTEVTAYRYSTLKPTGCIITYKTPTTTTTTRYQDGRSDRVIVVAGDKTFVSVTETGRQGRMLKYRDVNDNGQSTNPCFGARPVEDCYTRGGDASTCANEGRGGDETDGNDSSD